MQYSVQSDVGCLRQRNEDNFISRPDLGVWMVCDGMGGLERGDVASQLACKTVCERIAQGDDVCFAIEFAHRLIQHQASIRENSLGMGTTLVMLHVSQTGKRIYWVGDSRAYQLRHNSIRQLTKDHSKVQELIDAKLINIDEAKTHPHRHLLTQSVGVPMQRSVRVSEVSIDDSFNTHILLCSDGLTNELSDDEILHLVQLGLPTGNACKDLIDAAKKKGGKDNITVMLIEVDGTGDFATK